MLEARPDLDPAHEAALEAARSLSEALTTTREYLAEARYLDGSSEQDLCADVVAKRIELATQEATELCEALADTPSFAETLEPSQLALVDDCADALHGVVDAGFRGRDPEALLAARSELTQSYLAIQGALHDIRSLREATGIELVNDLVLEDRQRALEMVRDVARCALAVDADAAGLDLLHVRTAVGAKNPTERISARSVMGDTSASSVGGPNSQWLHLFARWLGGEEVRDNLASGSAAMNARMIPLERAVRLTVDSGFAVDVDIACLLHRETRLGIEIRYRVFVDDKLSVDVSLDLSRRDRLDAETRGEIAREFARMRDTLTRNESPDAAVARIAQLITQEERRADR